MKLFTKKDRLDDKVEIPLSTKSSRTNSSSFGLRKKEHTATSSGLQGRSIGSFRKNISHHGTPLQHADLDLPVSEMTTTSKGLKNAHPLNKKKNSLLSRDPSAMVKPSKKNGNFEPSGGTFSMSRRPNSTRSRDVRSLSETPKRMTIPKQSSTKQSKGRPGSKVSERDKSIRGNRKQHDTNIERQVTPSKKASKRNYNKTRIGKQSIKSKIEPREEKKSDPEWLRQRGNTNTNSSCQGNFSIPTVEDCESECKDAMCGNTEQTSTTTNLLAGHKVATTSESVSGTTRENVYQSNGDFSSVEWSRNNEYGDSKLKDQRDDYSYRSEDDYDQGSASSFEESFDREGPKFHTSMAEDTPKKNESGEKKNPINHNTPRSVNQLDSISSNSLYPDECVLIETLSNDMLSTNDDIDAESLKDNYGARDRAKDLPIQVESKTIDYLNSIAEHSAPDEQPRTKPGRSSGRASEREGSTFALDERVRSVSYESIYSGSYENGVVDDTPVKHRRSNFGRNGSELSNSVASETDHDGFESSCEESEEFGSSNDIAGSRIGIMAVSRKKGKSYGSKERLSHKQAVQPLSQLKSPIFGLDDFSKLHIISFLPAPDLRYLGTTNMSFMRLSRSLGLWIDHCSRRWAFLKYVLHKNAESQIAFKDMLLIPSAPYSLEQRAYLSMYKYHTVKDLVIKPENHHQHQSMVSPNMSLLHKMSTVYPSSVDKRFFVPVRTRSGKKIVPEFRSFKTKATTRAFSSINVQVMQFCAPIKGSLHVCQSNRPFPRSPEPIAPLMWGLLNPMESLLGDPPMAKPFCAPIVTMLQEDKIIDGPIKVELDVTPTLLAYFEVSIIHRDKSQEPREVPGQEVPALRSVPKSMTVGLARDVDKYHENKWLRGAFGYDGNNGTIFHMRSRTKRESAKAPRFGVGDTVGCGIDYASRSMFFTLNGYFLQAFLGVDLYEDYFATVDTISDSPFYVNFGMHPFLFDVSPFRKRHNSLIERSLPNCNDDSASDAISKDLVKGIQKYMAALGPSIVCSNTVPDKD